MSRFTCSEVPYCSAAMEPSLSDGFGAETHDGGADVGTLPCTMSSWQSSRDFPVCSIQTNTGPSVSDGYTSSLGPAVAVGLEISPGYSDQIVAFVVGRCAQ